MSISVLSKDNCPMCNATERAMKKKKITVRDDYSKQMLEDFADQDAVREELKAKNYSAFPIVETDTPVGSWCGYNPDKIRELAEYLASVDTTVSGDMDGTGTPMLVETQVA